MSMGNLEIGVCDDSLEDLKRIQIAIYKAAEKLGERESISIHLYKDGISMYKDSQSQGFSLVFLDWEMPEIDGFDLAGQLYLKNPHLKEFMREMVEKVIVYEDKRIEIVWKYREEFEELL